jgi:hypothetical protein
MTGLRGANLVLRFFLELAALGALGYWGFSTHETIWQKLLFGLGTPLLAAVVWGLFVAPKAVRPVPLPWRLLVEAVVFGAATAALLAAGRTTLGWVFLAVVVLSEVLLLTLRE